VKKIFAAWTLAAALFAPSLAVIHSDTFTDTNGTSLDAHSPNTGNGYDEEGSCEWEIQSNKAEYLSGSALCVASTDVADATVAVTADIGVPNDTNYSVGIILRGSDASNYWALSIGRDSGGTPALQLSENNAGVFTLRDSENLGAVTNTTQTVTLSVTGNDFTGSIGATQVTYTSSLHNTSTEVGLFTYTGSPYSPDGTWDNLSVDSDPSGGGGGGPTINPARNNPIRGGGLLGLVKGVLRVR
jgi:hypothetical protein